MKRGLFVVVALLVAVGVALAVTFSDNFNDGDLAGWTNGTYQGGSFTNTGTAVNPGAGFLAQMTYATGTSGNNQEGTIRFATLTGAAWTDAGVLLRANASDNEAYFGEACINCSGFTTRLGYIDSNQNGTTFASNSDVTWTSGDTLRFTISGTTLSIYRNGNATPVITYDDNTIASGPRVGLHGFMDAGGNTTDLSMDDFAGGDLTPPAAVYSRQILIQ